MQFRVNSTVGSVNTILKDVYNKAKHFSVSRKTRCIDVKSGHPVKNLGQDFAMSFFIRKSF